MAPKLKSILREARYYPDEGCTLFASKDYPAFSIDLERILHSSYFRRLQGKTQVWGTQESDFFRTRLTHSLETAHLCKIIGTLFKLPEDLMVSVGLAHDLGHPPFAHEGTVILNHFISEKSGGVLQFDDNAQNLRILHHLTSGILSKQEGLNLTASTLDGIIKYKNHKDGKLTCYKEEEELTEWIYKTCESQYHLSPVAAILELADDITYACHDLEDAMRAHMIPVNSLQAYVASAKNPRSKEILSQALMTPLDQLKPNHCNTTGLRKLKKLFKFTLIRELMNEIELLSKDETFLNMLFEPCTSALNPFYKKMPHLEEVTSILKKLVLDLVINDPNIQTQRYASLKLMESYLEAYWPVLDMPHLPAHRHAILSLPKQWQAKINEAQDPHFKLRLLIDYVSGMSDTYLTQQASLFFNPLERRAVAIRK